MTNILTHRRVNHGLTALVGLLGVYIVLTPFMPTLSYWFTERFPSDPPAYATAPLSTPPTAATPPTDNRLIIPSINLDEQIYTETTESTVDKGVWHRPATSTPDTLGNAVFVGHRFTYSSQVKDPFYHLDKVETGDTILVYWQKVPYVYTVNEITVVPPTAIEVESQDKGDRLTLYTCTPLWSSANRLVIVATRNGDTRE